MKIFNWVQRRFHNNVLKDGLARNVKKTDSIAIDTNTKALLEQVALVDVLDNWRDGILTIGTFGFDPLKSFNEKKDDESMESEKEEDDEEEEQYSVNNEEDDDDNSSSDEEVNPLMFSTLEHSFEMDFDSEIGKLTDVIMMDDGVAEGSIHDNEIKFDFDATDQGHSGKLRRRTTLADLFSEDSDIKKKPCSDTLEFHSKFSCKKPSLRTKNGLSFAKKLIPQVGEDSRPMKKLHQMMRRMLKRKIHPELEGKSNKFEGQLQAKSSLKDVLSASKKYEASESVSLLQTQIPDATSV
ncbi:hypothetical protein CCACVL1_21908 [Corchorus capsularis]|uniref:Protein TILLER ANGLE CONTROL 1 n=1 Tax=Corchorus capsularis TaxID=210143 RepID=A0A1R3H1P9_COCAP|nr:hypothetical protein CCACVL1_21908 [Corchorus capsularis]